MKQRHGYEGNDLPEQIQRQAGSDMNRRFMRAQALFRLDTDIPERFRELLHEIDHAEQLASGRC